MAVKTPQLFAALALCALLWSCASSRKTESPEVTPAIIGFRVQLIETTDPEEAKSIQKLALLRFDNEVYMTFDPPFYKVRVGDYIDWETADGLRKIAVEKGFDDAWVVKAKINSQ